MRICLSIIAQDNLLPCSYKVIFIMICTDHGPPGATHPEAFINARRCRCGLQHVSAVK
jgi:hypothetical protein